MGSCAFDIFDIVGPVMIGPSSSHTAGAVRIGLMAGQLCDYRPKSAEVLFYGSLEATYSFHKTDVGTFAGILGMDTDDERIPRAKEIAAERGVAISVGIAKLDKGHPSTIIANLKAEDGKEYSVRSATVGGGNIFVESVNGCEVSNDGKQNCVVGKSDLSEDELKACLAALLPGGTVEFIKEAPDGRMFKVVLDQKLDEAGKKRVASAKGLKEVYCFGAIMPASQEGGPAFYESVAALVRTAEERGVAISDLVIEYECRTSGRTEEQVLASMGGNYDVMIDAINKGIRTERKLLAGIFQGNARKMEEFIQAGKSICGVELSRVTQAALAVMELNASMGKVVACPTAGSAGTVPAAVLVAAKEKKMPKEAVVKALFAGAGIGKLAAEGANISGAVGGCQAECGVASALAACVLTELFGGTPAMVAHSFSLSLANLLGLVCDPVAGTVEMPCIQRNVISAVNAIVSAEMALAGVDSVIPADEMIWALDDVSQKIHPSLKDTLKGGISATPTAKAIEKRLFGKNF